MELPRPGRRTFSRLTQTCSRAEPYASTLGLFLVVACARVVAVGLYAESMPYQDQWDAEGERLLAPWLEGKLTWGELLIAPHNEHRVVWTRLLFLALFVLNGAQWDNLVIAYANTLLFASIYAFLFVMLGRGLGALWQKAVLAAVLIVLAVLPYAWENTLTGFQNQFYFMIGLAVATLALAAKGADSIATMIGVVALAFGSLFTMASGLLVAPLAAALLGLRIYAGSLGRSRGTAGVGLLLAIALAGFATLPRLPQHANLQVDTLQGWFAGFGIAASWPLSASWLHLLLFWSPLLFHCAWRFRPRRSSSAELLGLGLAAWALAQAAAIAYSRGRDMQGLDSRYGDLTAIGIVANVWFGLHAFDPWPGSARTLLAQRAAAFASGATTLVALFLRAPDDLVQLIERSDSARRQSENVRAFVADGDPTHLAGEIPYPHTEQLRRMLSNTTIRRALPPTLRKGLSLGGSAREPFVALGSVVSSCSAARCAEGVGRWRSADLTTTFDFIRLPFLYGETSEGLKLGVCGSEAGRSCSLKPLSGRVFTTAASAEPFHVELADETSASWIALGSPIEMNWLSLLSRQAKAWTRRAIPHDSNFSQGHISMRDLPCNDENPETWQLHDGVEIRAEVPVGQAGLLTGVAALRGAYDKKADGWLHGEVCTGGRCAVSELRLRRARGRRFFEAPLATPLAVRVGDKLQVRFWTVGATLPVGLGNCFAQAGSARVWGDPAFDMQGRTLRLRLQYLQVN